MSTLLGSREARGALALNPVLKVGVVHANDAAEFKHGQWIGFAPRHVSAPAFRAPDGVGDGFPSFVKCNVVVVHAQVTVQSACHLG